MFRVIVALAAAIVPGIVVFAWGALSDWQPTYPMLVFFGASAALIVFVGEWVRIGVYERDVRRRHPATQIGDEALTVESIQERAAMKGSFRITQRALDLIIVVPVIVMLMPLLVVAGLMVKFDSRGPVLYRQSRLGYRGREIEIYKFRTIYVAGGPASGGRRLTRAGRFLTVTSIDELPQMWNVLMGTMSLVGPRPLPQCPIEGMTKRQKAQLALLSQLKPGITGMPVGGRGSLAKSDLPLSFRSYFRALTSVFVILVGSEREYDEGQTRHRD